MLRTFRAKGTLALAFLKLDEKKVLLYLQVVIQNKKKKGSKKKFNILFFNFFHTFFPISKTRTQL